jgi:RNA recognition motif-containing protein
MMDHQVYPPSTECIIRNITPPTTGIWTYCRDYHSQQPKGFAFIEYATPEMAREAREEMNKFLMKGRELEVVYAQAQ